MKRFFLFVFLFVALAVQNASAQVPKTLSYQGILTDSNGNVVADGNYDLIFSIYDDSTGVSADWTETHNNLAVTNGLFGVVLGVTTTLDLDFSEQYWLGIKVGTDPEIPERIRLTSSAYTFRAIVADSALTVIDDAITTDKISDDAVTGVKIPDGHVAKSVNGLYDAIDIVAGSNVTVVTNGSTITVSSSGTAGVSLDTAYDGGSAIDTDNGAVAINGAGGLTVADSVGIGTSSPSERLELVGGSTLRFGSNGDSGDNEIYLRGGTTGDKAYITFNHYGHADYVVGAGLVDDGIFSITKTNGGTDGILLNTSGNIGIGTSSPASALSGDNSHEVVLTIEGDSNSSGLMLTDPDDANKSVAITNSGQQLTISAANDDGSSSSEWVRMVDGNVGIGSVPESWLSTQTGLDLGGLGALSAQTATTAGGNIDLMYNTYLGTSGNYKWKTSSEEVARLALNNGTFGFYTKGTGTADADISGWTTAMYIENDGKVGIGTATPGARLHVQRKTSTAHAPLRIDTEASAGSGNDPYIQFTVEDGDSVKAYVGFDNTSRYFYIRDGFGSENLRIYPDGGLVAGNPTGGSKGAGTINAQAVYDDNTQLSDYVFDWYFDGKIQAEDEHLHGDYRMLSLDEMIVFMMKERHLPTIKGRKHWKKNGKFSIGELTTQLWATVETQAIYIKELKEQADVQVELTQRLQQQIEQKDVALQQQQTELNAQKAELQQYQVQLSKQQAVIDAMMQRLANLEQMQGGVAVVKTAAANEE